LDKKVTADEYIYMEIQKDMYGLPQAGIIAQELLEKRLAKHGYTQSKIILGFWKHTRKQICFTLVVDNFAVKYMMEQDAEHLISTQKQTMTLQSIKQQKNQSNSQSNGTSKIKKSTHPCQGI
jgi:hypothetical protein